MRIIIVTLCSLLLLGSCEKDKFTTNPQLTYKSVNNKVLTRGQLLQFKLGFTDKEGDADSIFIKKITPQCGLTIFADSASLPDDFKVTKQTSGDLLISYGYAVSGFRPIGDPQCSFNDTCTFRFVLQDKEKHKSDTVYSESIVIIK